MTTAIEPEVQAAAIEVPAKPSIQTVEEGDQYGKFVIEPLQRGYAVTLGNALRRVLLGSLPGAAVTAVQIEGVQHEYSIIPEVREDVSQLLLNVKGVRLRAHAEQPGTLRLQVQGPGVVTAGDIQPTTDFDIVNPEVHLATLDSAKARLSMELFVNVGRGYGAAAPADGMPIGVLPLDAVFTPIRKVNYTVERTRVGQVTDYERLILEITTDGSKAPAEVLQEAGQLLVESFEQVASFGMAAFAGAKESDLARRIPADQYNMQIERLELSARTLNCLKRSKINKVGEILEMSREELLKIKNFGEKSLEEVHERLRALGLMEGEGVAAPAGKPEAALPQAPALVPARARERPHTARRDTVRDLASLRELLVAEAEGSDSPSKEKKSEQA